MKDLVLEPTLKSPLFEFSPKGILVIEGKAISIQTEADFKPAIRWCKRLTSIHVFLMVKLDYMNMASSREMVRLINTLDNNPCVEELNVSWYYDEDNYQMLETGKVLSEIIPNSKFNFFRI